MREGRFKKWTVEVGQGFASVYQTVAKRVLDYLNNSEVLKVNTRELECHVLAPNEPKVNIEHTVMQAIGEGHEWLFQAIIRQAAREILVASLATWGTQG